jgi:uncharacterized protein
MSVFSTGFVRSTAMAGGLGPAIARWCQSRGMGKRALSVVIVLTVAAACRGGAVAAERELVYGPPAHASAATTIARAKRGDVLAAERLGWLFSTGRGVPQNYREAAKWFYRAAIHGDGVAQYALGMLYNKGQGVSRDYVLSYMWLNLSASQASGANRDYITRLRDALALKMTPKQLATAQELALAWHKSH